MQVDDSQEVLVARQGVERQEGHLFFNQVGGFFRFAIHQLERDVVAPGRPVGGESQSHRGAAPALSGLAALQGDVDPAD
ncbi:hypothetical protein SB766_23870, partial [Pseudomonas sp. SIMBA_077]